MQSAGHIFEFSTVLYLGIVALGVACVVFGRELHLRATRRLADSDAMAGKWQGQDRITLRRRLEAPGVGLAILGVVILAVMILYVNPSTPLRGPAVARAPAPQLPSGMRAHLIAPAEATEIFRMLVDRGQQQERHGRYRDAMRFYRSALAMPSTPVGEAAIAMGRIGAVYRGRGMLVESLAMARLAADIAPDNAAMQYELALTLAAVGELGEAREVMRLAVILDPSYLEDLEQLSARLR